MRGVGGWQRLGPSSPPHTRHEPLPHIEPCVFSPSPAQGKVIPDSVSWGGQSGGVFSAMSVDFMKPVVAKVDQLLQVCLRLRGEGRGGRGGQGGEAQARGRLRGTTWPLQDGRINVTVAEGQLDLICLTAGACVRTGVDRPTPASPPLLLRRRAGVDGQPHVERHAELVRRE